MKLADGSEQPLASLSVRATEYSVGPNGPKAMPATLPPQSGYTYCVELSADEALAANATSVEFSQEVAFYVDNFLGFPTGEGVPVGYYDRVQAIWVPLWNGRVVKILGIDGGLATIDTDGDGAADDDLFMTADERHALAGLYVPGQTLWRIPLEHFTPFDGNWPLTAGNPDGALPPVQAPPRSEHQPDDPACRYGSVIQCESQALGESIPIAGTPFSLTYNSARVAGRIAARKMDVSLTSALLPPDLEGVELIEIGGQEWTRSYAPFPNLKQEFEWDGRDVYGRDVNGNFYGDGDDPLSLPGRVPAGCAGCGQFFVLCARRRASSRRTHRRSTPSAAVGSVAPARRARRRVGRMDARRSSHARRGG